MDVPGRILPGIPKESAKDVAPIPRVYPRKETRLGGDFYSGNSQRF
jgi:hypothetical protein